MIRRLLTALAIFSAASLAAPSVGHAQTFKVEKFDIKGEVAPTTSPSKPPRAACSWRVPPT